MEELKFETGVVEFDVNGKTKISFNPTDPAFVERVYGAFLSIANGYEAGEGNTFKDNDTFFDYVRERDRDVRKTIDGLFGDGASAGLFGDVSSYAMADGLPLWCNFLLAVIDTVPEELSAQVKKSKPRVDKYLQKYHH